MTSGKASLEEMAAAVEGEAIRIAASLRAHAQKFPDAKPDQEAHRTVFALDSAAHLLRILGTYEERSRKFVNDLLAEHRRG